MSNLTETKLLPASGLSKLDITGKFVVTIVSGLAILFTIAAFVIVTQQRNALEELQHSADKVVETNAKSNTDERQTSEEAKVRRLIDILKKISPTPVADLQISVLEDYAKVMLQDPNLSYITFLNADGEILATAGNKEKLNPINLTTEDLVVEGTNVGKISVGFNFDRLNQYVEKTNEKRQQNLQQMSLAMDKSLDTSKLSLVVIMAVMCFAISILVAYLFRIIVTNRLTELENRLQDIAQGDGDLRQRIVVKSNDVIGRVGNHFNAFLEKIHNTINKVVAATGQLTSSSEQMTLITEESRADMSQQNNEIDMAATAINEMATTVQEVARNAATAAESAQNADNEAKNGMKVVTQAIESINELAGEVDRAADVIQKLEEDSHSIGVVLDVIRGIAEQTNLLALNAAIEAARAGEQGRGFAVVADEVRTLASRTQKSTEEIQQMIQQLQAGTSNAVKVMESGRNQAQHSVERAAEAGSSLETITRSVAVISDMNVQIASAAEEQGAVAEEINRNIVSVNEIAKKSVLGADQTAASSAELSDLATELRSLVQTFKV